MKNVSIKLIYMLGYFKPHFGAYKEQDIGDQLELFVVFLKFRS